MSFRNQNKKTKLSNKHLKLRLTLGGARNDFCLLILEVLMFYLDTNDEEAKQSKVYYESRLSMMEEGEYFEEEEDEDEDEEESSSGETEKPKPKEEFMLHYERLCRGESNKVCIARSGRSVASTLWEIY